MADPVVPPSPDAAKSDTAPADKSTKSAPVPAVNVISGAESLLGTDVHFGIAVRVTSSGGSSVLMIPDVTAVASGAQPVYITKPISLKLEKLQSFLTKKGVDLPKQLADLLKDANIDCNAFYFTAKDGPLLMMFSLRFNDGLLESLTGDKDIGNLFDIEGVAVRVFRCSEDKFPVLQKYAKELAA